MSWIAASNWVLFSVSKSSIYLIVLLNFLANIMLFLIRSWLVMVHNLYP